MNIYEVKYSLWSMKIGMFGGIVQGLDDINQCIDILIKTRKGTVPLHPEFGCDVWKYIDSPINIARANIVKEVVDSITEFIPIIQLVSVTVNIQNTSNLVISIEWTLNNDTEVNATEVTYELAGS